MQTAELSQRDSSNIMNDTIIFDEQTRRVTVVKTNGNTFIVASYDTTNDHRRGAFVLGDHGSRFRVSQETKAKVLKYFYPDDSLVYLKKHGYIAS